MEKVVGRNWSTVPIFGMLYHKCTPCAYNVRHCTCTCIIRTSGASTCMVGKDHSVCESDKDMIFYHL